MADILVWAVPAAFFIDAIIGDPVYRFHPIRIIGNNIITPVENFLRSVGANGKFGGFLLLMATLSLSTGGVILVEWLSGGYPLILFLFNVYIIYSCIALKDLKKHTDRVSRALGENDIEGARAGLAFVVGRETRGLTPEEIRRAIVETLSENLSDGVIAPLFFAVLGGAPLAVFYKAANTMDSMTGYKNKKYKDFGFFPAKFDDLINWIPARLSLLLILLGGIRHSENWKESWKIALSERNNHTSPNAAYPEAAMAGLLGLRLGGPNNYHGKIVHKPFINENGIAVGPDDVAKAWDITYKAALLSLIIFCSARLFFVL